MSDSAATPPSWSGPGAIQIFITLPEDSKISEQTLLQWLDEEYIPASLKSGVVKSAWRFKAADPAYGKQHMVMCKVPDLAPVAAGKLQEIPRTSSLFPNGASADDLFLGETKIFSFVQLYQTEKQPEDAGTTIIMAAMEPSSPEGEIDLDAWYREEHNQQMSEQPGWKRTTRFNLLFQHRTDGKEVERISFLAIHEFGDGHKIKKTVEPLDPMTDWTESCMADAKAIDAAVFEKVKVFGAAATSS